MTWDGLCMALAGGCGVYIAQGDWKAAAFFAVLSIVCGFISGYRAKKRQQ